MAGVMSTVPRPPTPPRSSSRTDISSDIEAIAATDRLTVDTPDDSPASYISSIGSGAGRIRKRVDFSPWAPPIITPTSAVKTIKPLPPSRDLKSSKSILKMSNEAVSVLASELAPAHSYDRLTDMLKSILQQLAVGGRSTSLDAYTNLAGTLKAYNDSLEGLEMREQVQDLCRYIRRDLQQDIQETGALDSNIVTSALKVAVIFVWDKNYAVLLTDEFRSFVIDRAIRALEDDKTPKSIMLHYLHFLATQNFRPNIMTASRADRILEALKEITKNVSGHNIVSERHMVYQRFAEQSPNVLKSKAFWIEHLLDGMTSNIQDIRNRALAFGTKVSSALPFSVSVCKNLKETLDRRLEDGKTYDSYLTRRLIKMLAVQGEGPIVPKVWAIIVKLLRGSNLQQFEKGPHLKSLLHIIQKCFNSGNSDVRASAYLAWNQFIFITRPSNTTPASLQHLLVSPMSGQLRRSDAGKETKSNRTTAASAYCCLLYYSFRPSAPYAQYTQLFREYISRNWTEQFLSVTTNTDRACRILMSLFWNEKSKYWTETRVNEPAMFEPDDLPRVDCKWVRSNSSSILDAFELLFRKAYWGPQNSDHAFIALAWKSFAKALGEACRKEIKPSSETIEAVANIMTLLRRIWAQGPDSLNSADSTDPDAFVKRFHLLSKAVFSEIGAIPFVEPKLVNNPERFLAANASKSLSVATPVEHYLCFLHTPSASSQGRFRVGTAFSVMLGELLGLLVDGRAPKAAHFELYAKCIRYIVKSDYVSMKETTFDWTLKAVLRLIQHELANAKEPTILANSPLGPQHHSGEIEILYYGALAGKDCLSEWTSVLRETLLAVQIGQGHGAAITQLLEPLAERLCDDVSDMARFHAAVIVAAFAENKEFFRIGNQMTKARTTPALSTPVVNQRMVALINTHLSSAYAASSTEDIQSVQKMIDASSLFIRRCPRQQVAPWFVSLQLGLREWLGDPDQKLSGVNDQSMLKRASARLLWSSIIDRLCDLPVDQYLLSSAEVLFVSSFTSSQRDVVNEMVEKWNVTYGSLVHLEYPSGLQDVLIRLRSHVDLQLPGLASAGLDQETASPLRFDEVYNESAPDRMPLLNPRRSVTPLRAMAQPWPTASAKSFSTIEAKPLATTPTKSRRVPQKTSSNPRVSHDDSQIQFATIDSSPLGDPVMDSQLLTDRQKEVRERQQADMATVFVDLRSSPTPHTRRARTSTPIVAPNVFAAKPDAEPSTPTLPANEPREVDENFLSSPTPRSSQHEKKVDEVDIPSSPASDHDASHAKEFGGPGIPRVASDEKSDPLPMVVSTPVLAPDEAGGFGDCDPNENPRAILEAETLGKVEMPPQSIEILHEMSPNTRSLTEQVSIVELVLEGDDLKENAFVLDAYREEKHRIDLQTNSQTLLQEHSSKLHNGREDKRTAIQDDTMASELLLEGDDQQPMQVQKEEEAQNLETDDFFDSQIAIQLSQDLEQHAEDTESAALDIHPSDSESTSPEERAKLRGGDMVKRRGPRLPRNGGRSSSQSIPPEDEQIGDTIVVDTSRLRQPTEREAESAVREHEADVTNHPTPMQTSEMALQSNPTMATFSPSQTQLTRKRKSMELATLKNETDNGFDRHEETPSKKIKMNVAISELSPHQSPSKQGKNTMRQDIHASGALQSSAPITFEPASGQSAEQDLPALTNTLADASRDNNDIQPEDDDERPQTADEYLAQGRGSADLATSPVSDPLTGDLFDVSEEDVSGPLGEKVPGNTSQRDVVTEEGSRHDLDPSEADVINSLQRALDQLSHAKISREGVRTIADLVFEIRSAAEKSVRAS